MAEVVLRAVPASPGTVVGEVYAIDVGGAQRAAGAELRAAAEHAVEAERALAALEQAALDVEAVAGKLRADGHDDDAAIVETGALMARDPALAAAAEAAVRDCGLSAAAAIAEAAEAHAAAIAALPDANLAARADDVRSVARRAARLAAGRGAVAIPPGAILIADDLGPADVAELDENVAGIALAGGGATAHAAIVARSLGVPMVVGGGEALLRVVDGTTLALDGDAGTIVIEPGAARRKAARVAMARERELAARIEAARGLPARTRDGHDVRILVNAAYAPEVRAGLRAGAEGVGLLRTELAFLAAPDWPSEEDHRRALMPLLGLLRGRPATVRVLDFGADKSPPFLRGTAERGTAVLLAHPDALDAQLRAILAAGRDTRLRVLFPMIASADELASARERVVAAADALGLPVPQLGAMVEVPAAAQAAAELARIGDFVSIGTNDLTHATLGSDRFGGGGASGAGSDRFAGGEAVAHHPRVLAHIAQTAEAAHAAGVPVEVCGEAAADPLTLPLLVGLGVDELSAGAARVGALRAWVRELSREDAAKLAARALEASTARDVAALLLQRRDPRGERLDGAAGVLALGPQP
jgi:phosphoenolpyruvate-protein kinase (PTS system EI component)